MCDSKCECVCCLKRELQRQREWKAKLFSKLLRKASEIDALKAEVERLKKDNANAWQSAADWREDYEAARNDGNGARNEVKRCHDILNEAGIPSYNVSDSNWSLGKRVQFLCAANATRGEVLANLESQWREVLRIVNGEGE